jgi:hypothetical protein
MPEDLYLKTFLNLTRLAVRKLGWIIVPSQEDKEIARPMT